MLSYSVYKLMHLTGIIMTFVALGSVMSHVFTGGTKADNQWRKVAGMTHGVGLLLVLVAGFGMLARLGLSPAAGWVIAKLIIWLVLGGISAVIYKMGTKGQSLWYAVILLGVLAAYFAITKPF